METTECFDKYKKQKIRDENVKRMPSLRLCVRGHMIALM